MVETCIDNAIGGQVPDRVLVHDAARTAPGLPAGGAAPPAAHAGAQGLPEARRRPTGGRIRVGPDPGRAAQPRTPHHVAGTSQSAFFLNTIASAASAVQR